MVFYLVLFFRSSSIDSTPLETSSETLPKDMGTKDIATSVIEEKVEESQIPAVVKPPHTSPDPSFASEVTSHRRNSVWNSKIKFIKVNLSI